MAVSPVVPLPKSQPDISKLNTFTGHTVTVTKHTAPRNTVGAMVVPTQPMKLEQILKLMGEVPLMHGPGFYSFTVTDTGGTGDDTWMVKLGPDVQEASPMPGPVNGVPPTTGPQALGEGVIHLGHGFYYNEAMGTLTTPWRTIVSWKQGDPMPQAPVSPAAQQQGSHLSLVPPNATPWNSGWGGYPVNDDSSKVKQLEAQIAEDRQQRREADMRADNARRDAEVRQMISDSNARFEKLIEKLATKPQGESPELLALRTQNEAMQRRLDDEKREREREASENRIREEQRTMFRELQALITASTANKQDPLLPMLMQMMQQMNGNSMEAVKAIQASTANASTAAERQVQALVEQLRGTIMSPMQMMQMIQSAKSDGVDGARLVTESMGRLMDTQRTVFEQLLDVAGQGGSPPWVQAIEAVSSKIGPIGEAIMAQRAAQAQQPRVVVRQVPVPVDAATGLPIQRTANGAIVTPAPAPAPAALSGQEAGAPAEGTEAAAPAKAAKKKSRKKNGRKGKMPMDGKITIEKLREMDPDDVAKFADKFVDNAFFGDQLYSHIATLRQQVTAGMTAETAASVLWQSRGQLANIQPIPPAVELFMAEQIEVLIERILPEASPDFREAVTTLIEDQLEAEAEGDEGETE